MAQGFPPDAGVDIGIGRVNSEYDVIAATRTNDNGSVEMEITIPSFVEPEDTWVIVVSAQMDSLKQLRTNSMSHYNLNRVKIYLPVRISF